MFTQIEIDKFKVGIYKLVDINDNAYELQKQISTQHYYNDNDRYKMIDFTVYIAQTLSITKKLNDIEFKSAK